MDIRKRLKEEILIFDGAMGSIIQSNNINIPPELVNISNPELITNIHENYINAGADIITTNTFGAYSHKYDNLDDIIRNALINAKKAVLRANKDTLIAYDLGPTGKLLKPLGDLDFEDAYNLFKESAILGEKYGADLIILETLSDTYEAKAGILAVKENTNLPIICTMTFDEKQQLLTGGDLLTMISLLESLEVDVIGINCGLGPKQIINMIDSLVKYSSTPILIQPNAGLPTIIDGKTAYDLDPTEFSNYMEIICKKGVNLLGGCCGTNYEYIKMTADKCKKLEPTIIEEKDYTFISSGNKALILGEIPLIVGERINPTGKKDIKKSLINKDFEIIKTEAIVQKENGSHILDVNMGLPEIDEAQYMEIAIKEIQSIVNLPLQIDSNKPEVIERALRIYNGKAIINSVSCKDEDMAKILPLIKKYGGVIIGLLVDENGIPEMAEDRLEVAKRFIETALSYGIKKKNIIIDPLTLTVSAQQKEALETLKALRMIKSEFNVHTLLGVSNISFGLPNRDLINSTFFSLALDSGLDLAIINPLSNTMMDTYRAFKVLSGYDENSVEYIDYYKDISDKKAETIISKSDLSDIIIKGLKEPAYEETKILLKTMEPIDIIDNYIIKGLDYVGEKFEIGKMFLPQLIMSAESAKYSFKAIEEDLKSKGEVQESKGTIVLATVFGDSHDIGKNIVKAILENYGYNIIDLGKDVPIDKITDCVIENNIKLVGLSALMTTTVVNMEKTINELNKLKPDCKIMVGGAVLNQDYADMINADYYSKDALSAVPIAREVFGK